MWEQRRASHPLRRALALLDACWPAKSAWSAAPIGQRDSRLLDLRETLFGPQLQTVTRCPNCTAQLEANFMVADIREPLGTTPSEMFKLRTGGYVVEYRLPNSEDLLAVSSFENVSNAREQLLRRCIASIRRPSRRRAPDQLPAEVIDALEADMARHDPAADTQIALRCPACGHEWQASFDVVSYLWDELEDWAQRTLADVHLLARAYGWTEGEILSLSPTRRQQYVEMVRA